MESNLAYPISCDNSDVNFLIEDVVVKIHGDDDSLLIFAMHSMISPGYCYIGEPDAEDGKMIEINKIRHAKVAEIQAKRRLTNEELALAEVS